VSRYYLVYKIDETYCRDRLFGQVVVTGYLYMFGPWFMHLLMVQVDAWYMLVQVIGTGCLVQVDWYKLL
jgi:hypothetical protein